MMVDYWTKIIMSPSASKSNSDVMESDQRRRRGREGGSTFERNRTGRSDYRQRGELRTNNNNNNNIRQRDEQQRNERQRDGLGRLERQLKVLRFERREAERGLAAAEERVTVLAVTEALWQGRLVGAQEEEAEFFARERLAAVSRERDRAERDLARVQAGMAQRRAWLASLEEKMRGLCLAGEEVGVVDDADEGREGGTELLSGASVSDSNEGVPFPDLSKEGGNRDTVVAELSAVEES